MKNLLILFFLLLPLNAFAAPKIVATIKPIHSIIAAVTDGITEPYLLIDGNASPHSYTLRPSDMKSLSNADFIFLVSDNLEVFMQKIAADMDKSKVVKLAALDGITLYKMPEDDHDNNHNHDAYDPHIWLSPANAIFITKNVAKILAESDPDNAAKYNENADNFIEEIKSADEIIKAKLVNIREFPHIYYHNAYQYFDKYYGLNGVASILPSGKEHLSAKKLSEISKTIKEKNIKCLFKEPQFSNETIEAIANGTDIKVGTLDPIGAKIKAGKNAYLGILNEIMDNLTECLK